MYDWQPPWENSTRTLTLDGRRFLADSDRHGWTLSELVSAGSVRKIAEGINWSEIDRALQQYIGGN